MAVPEKYKKGPFNESFDDRFELYRKQFEQESAMPGGIQSHPGSFTKEEMRQIVNQEIKTGAWQPKPKSTLPSIELEAATQAPKVSGRWFGFWKEKPAAKPAPEPKMDVRRTFKKGGSSSE